MLDLGTGSGCILLSILKEFKKATGIGIDKYLETVKVARINSKRNSNFFIPTIYNNFKRRRRRRSTYGLVTLINQSFF